MRWSVVVLAVACVGCSDFEESPHISSQAMVIPEVRAWYSVGEDGTYQIFDSPGLDPRTNKPLQAATDEIMFKAQAQREGMKGSPEAGVNPPGAATSKTELPRAPWAKGVATTFGSEEIIAVYTVLLRRGQSSGKLAYTAPSWQSGEKGKYIRRWKIQGPDQSTCSVTLNGETFVVQPGEALTTSSLGGKTRGSFVIEVRLGLDSPVPEVAVEFVYYRVLEEALSAPQQTSGVQPLVGQPQGTPKARGSSSSDLTVSPPPTPEPTTTRSRRNREPVTCGIVGSTIDEHGKPIQGLSVFLYADYRRLRKSPPKLVTTSDENGRYGFQATDGRYRVKGRGVIGHRYVSNEGYFWIDVADNVTSYDVDIREGSHLETNNLKLDGRRGDWSAVRGKVISLTFDYRVWYRKGNAGAVVYLAIGADGNGLGAHSAGSPGRFPGRTGSARIKFKPPNKKGAYTLYALLAPELSVQSAVRTYNASFPDQTQFIPLGTLQVQ